MRIIKKWALKEMVSGNMIIRNLCVLDEKKTNVPQARFLYRVETLNNEIKDLKVISRTSYE